MFAYLDCADIEGAVRVEVRITLASHKEMTIRAGGPGTYSGPALPPFETYEVLVDHDPPHCWDKYGHGAGALFSHVPRLLVSDHIICCGGISEIRGRTIASEPMTVLSCSPAPIPHPDYCI